MANYVLSCCSTADLSKEHFEERDIHYICFHYKLDGVDHPDDLGQTIPFEEFYKKMDEGADTVTSQVNVSEYVEYFSKFLEAGKDILQVSGINYTQDGVQLLKDVSFIFNKGDKIAFVGEDELAKTTLFKILMGELEPDW